MQLMRGPSDELEVRCAKFYTEAARALTVTSLVRVARWIGSSTIPRWTSRRSISQSTQFSWGKAAKSP
jgi:hypothetical protein